MPSDPSSAERIAVVLRVSEIFLKGQNRGAFVKRFVDNARGLLRGTSAEIEASHLRFVVTCAPSEERQVVERLGRLFGLHSMSRAALVPADLDAIAAEALKQAGERPVARTFKVEARRRDKSFPLGSQELAREIGGRIHTQQERPVDVHNPDFTVHVEIGRPNSFVFVDTISGPGGLPIGSSGAVALLLSGGIDSPVAGYSMMRRGCRIGAIYFHSFPFTGDKSKEKVIDLARHLARYQGELKLDVVHFTDVQKQLREHGKAELAVILYRRMMVRCAAKLAAANRQLALVTGDNLGQVASQTLENLSVVEEASPLPILRPLLAYDKSEIVERARAIGTFETSILPYDDCCSLFVPKHPATRARLDAVLRSEEGLDVDAMAQSLADGVESLVIEATA
jgi:thiamine biosynthesis protein ThiI